MRVTEHDVLLNRIALQPLRHFRLTGEALTQLDLCQDRAVIDNRVDIMLTVAGENRGFWDNNRVVTAIDDNLNAGEQARKENLVRVRDAGAKPHGAPVFIDDRINDIDFALKRLAGTGVNRDPDCLSGMKA